MILTQVRASLQAEPAYLRDGILRMFTPLGSYRRTTDGMDSLRVWSAGSGSQGSHNHPRLINASNPTPNSVAFVVQLPGRPSELRTVDPGHDQN